MSDEERDVLVRLSNAIGAGRASHEILVEAIMSYLIATPTITRGREGLVRYLAEALRGIEAEAANV